MKLDVYFTPLGPKEGDVSGRGVVVIDVLRATTTIVTALANGAKAVVPAATSEEAVRLTANLERNGYLLAGERRSLKIEGFQLGNSPREMTADVVGGKTIYLATTNGTPALVAAQGAHAVLVGAAVNFKAVTERARQLFLERGELAVICAGRDRQFALEDAYMAGRLVGAVKRGHRKTVLNDAAEVALSLTTRYKNWLAALERTAAARQLHEVDLGEDVAFAAKPDRFDTVPIYVDRRIT
jgi:2-phosphosulfolactate phosphatase